MNPTRLCLHTQRAEKERNQGTAGRRRSRARPRREAETPSGRKKMVFFGFHPGPHCHKSPRGHSHTCMCAHLQTNSYGQGQSEEHRSAFHTLTFFFRKSSDKTVTDFQDRGSKSRCQVETPIIEKLSNTLKHTQRFLPGGHIWASTCSLLAEGDSYKTRCQSEPR